MKKLWFCLLCIGLPIHGFSRVYTVDGISFEMVQVEGGRFLMGAQKDDATQANYNPKASFDEQPVHYVNLRDYQIGKYPVTQELWFAVTRQQPVADATHQWFSEAGYGIGYPAYYISYNDALTFIAALNDSLSASGQLQHGDFPSAHRGGMGICRPRRQTESPLPVCRKQQHQRGRLVRVQLSHFHTSGRTEETQRTRFV